MKVQLKLISISIVFLFLNGCISVQSKVAEDNKPDLSSAYLYGTFSLSTSDNVGLSIILEEFSTDSNAELNEYYIGFNKNSTPKVDMIEVPPGKYNINGLLNLQKDLVGYNPRGRSKLFKTSDPIVITLEAGNAYYIGDYSGTSSVSCAYSSCNYSWQLSSIENTMDKSTMELKNQYKLFQAVPTHSLILDIVNQVREKLSLNQ